MKLQDTNYGFEGQLPESRIGFQIKSSAKLFGILSSGIYTDKILAVIRELCCNAHDAHVAAKKSHVPFKVTLPNRLDPIFRVEDEGTGIPPELIGKIYWTYGESTKSETNDQIGALGLGSKSPFAYTKSSFIVKNRYQSVEHTYMCFINEAGTPDGSELSAVPTDLPDGVSVELAVRKDDIDEFANRARRFFRYWPHTKPTIEGIDSTRIYQPSYPQLFAGDDWYLEKRSSTPTGEYPIEGTIAVMGGVTYPLKINALPVSFQQELRGISLAQLIGAPFIINFPMGALSFAASREELEYDERTVAAIKKALKKVHTELSSKLEQAMVSQAKTGLEFASKVGQFVTDISNELRIHNVRECLLPKLIVYGGHSYSMEVLLDQSKSVRINHPTRPSYGLYEILPAAARGRSSVKVTYATTVHSQLTAELDHLPGVKVGRDYATSWRTFDGQKKHKPLPLLTNGGQYHISLLLDRYPAHFTNDAVSVVSFRHSQLKLLINDVGASGADRARRYVLKEMAPANHVQSTSYYLVQLDVGADPAKAQAEVVDLLNRVGLDGTETVLISSLPDLRPKVPAAVGKKDIRLGHLQINFSNREWWNDREIPAASTTKSFDFFSLDQLKAKPMFFLYRATGVRNLSDVYTWDPKVGRPANQLNYSNLMRVGINLKVITADEVASVLCITAAEVKTLRRRGVVLTCLTDVIKERAKALLDKSQAELKILEAAERTVSQGDIAHLFANPPHSSNIRDLLLLLTCGSALLKASSDLIGAQEKLGLNKAGYLKLKLSQLLNGTTPDDTREDQLCEELSKRYPLLHRINLNYVADIPAIAEYITLIDEKHAKIDVQPG